MSDTTQLNDQLHWYKDAIIYELHIKAFKDGTGDGIGDFQGLMEKLDYLEDLGVTAIWVLPFYPSPLRDDGYDIADYYSINPSFGDLDQFKLFLDEAHKRNLKVITELVINHTSDQHPWFQRARKSPQYSDERAFYVWSDDPKKYSDVRIIFQDTEKSNWTWDAEAGQYYWHRFFHHQPDLNYDNPLVQEEIFKILDFWCAMGVDGFRLDAVPYLFEREGTNGENLPETHAFLKKLRSHIDERFPGIVFLAEANMWPEDSASYFGDGDECHMNYHFPVMPRMFMALEMEDRYPITDIFDQTPAIPDNCQWAIFLRNHDELTLEMVTDEERDYMYKVYAKDPKAKINLGIRHRLAPLMDNDRRKIELMNCLLFSLAGTPVIYYGDEIGMGDNVYLGDRDGVRTPMQWNGDRNAGFSSANPQKLYLPVVLDPEYQYEAVNVETQRRNSSSLFWFMKRMIAMRKKHKAFGRGDLKFIDVENPKILAFTRTYLHETMLIVVNLSRYSQPAELDLCGFEGYVPVEVVSKNRFPPVKKDNLYFFTMGPHAFQWFILQKTQSEVGQKEALPLLEIADWQRLTSPATLYELENDILPAYLPTTRWFAGKYRVLRSLKIESYFTIPLPKHNALFVLVESVYESGLPEMYLLPLIFVTEHFAHSLKEKESIALISRMKLGQQDGYLCDALYTPALRLALINLLAQDKIIRQPHSLIKFTGNADIQKHVAENETIKSRILPVEDSNTSIGYDNRFFLKIYRKVDKAINPDVEITRFLTEGVDFAQVPAYLGGLEWKFGNESMVLGMAQVMVEYHGNGRVFMLERLSSFQDKILALNKDDVSTFEFKGSLVEPLSYDELPANLKALLGGQLAEVTHLMGIRTGEMHKALATSTTNIDFTPENFSLHYQRSLFSGLQSLVRESYNNLDRKLHLLNEDELEQATQVLHGKQDVLNMLKRIYAHKLDVTKIRIHGNYNLRKAIYTGKDLAILDFGGDPVRSYSERRLKRSPLRDVAGMIRSFCYASFEGLLLQPAQKTYDKEMLQFFARLWAHSVSGIFMHAYLQTIEGESFLPTDKKDMRVMLQTFLLEKAVYSLNYELNNRLDWVKVPLMLIDFISNAGPKKEAEMLSAAPVEEGLPQ